MGGIFICVCVDSNKSNHTRESPSVLRFDKRGGYLGPSVRLYDDAPITNSDISMLTLVVPHDLKQVPSQAEPKRISRF